MPSAKAKFELSAMLHALCSMPFASKLISNSRPFYSATGKLLFLSFFRKLRKQKIQSIHVNLRVGAKRKSRHKRGRSETKIPDFERVENPGL
jgi:hypothetical protein